MSLLVKKRLISIDMILFFYFKGKVHLLDGLNKFFKIHNKYRREHFMFRTICIPLLQRQK